jgi:hypothetical protein
MAGRTTNGTTAAELLQQKADSTARAMDQIDARPETVLDALEAHVTVDPSAGQLNLQDVFGLFVQMQQQQAAMQQQLVSLLARQGETDQKRSAAHSRAEVAQMQEQQRLTLEAWKTEPRLPVFLQPSEDEKKIFAVVGEWPPRVHRVNGLEFPIKVGEVVNVPESIYEQITWGQTYSATKAKKNAQSLATIADPERGQFLANSQSIVSGTPGVVGAGPLQTTPGAASPAQARPLDVRYDHEGR